MHACFHAQDKIVDLLLEKGADPNLHAGQFVYRKLLIQNNSQSISTHIIIRAPRCTSLESQLGAILGLLLKNVSFSEDTTLSLNLINRKYLVNGAICIIMVSIIL